MIYYIGNKDAKIVKIGYTKKNIKSRLSAIQVGNSNKLNILNTREGNKKDEKYIHSLLKTYHIRGEWFIYCKEVMDTVDLKIDKSISQLYIIDTNYFIGSIKLLRCLYTDMTLAEIKVYSFLVENYNHNDLILINKQLKESIKESCNLKSIGSISNTLTLLCNKETPMLIKTKRGFYRLNSVHL